MCPFSTLAHQVQVFQTKAWGSLQWVIGVPLAFLWTWMQSSASSPSVGVHAPIVKKACPLFCTLSPIFLFLNPPFHHSCFSLFPSKLPSNKHGPTLLFFLVVPASAASVPKFGVSSGVIGTTLTLYSVTYMVAWVLVTLQDFVPQHTSAIIQFILASYCLPYTLIKTKHFILSLTLPPSTS